jgi:hypothetical protein
MIVIVALFDIEHSHVKCLYIPMARGEKVIKIPMLSIDSNPFPTDSFLKLGVGGSLA